MVGHGGKRPGAGRPKGSKNKTTVAREAVAEVLGVDDTATLDAAIHQRGHALLQELERIVLDPTFSPSERIVAAKVALPFLLPKMDVVAQGAEEAEQADDFIELIRQRRQQVAAMRERCLIASNAG
jgi:hypothetical protein